MVGDVTALFKGGFGELVDLDAQKKARLQTHMQVLEGLSSALVKEHGSFILEDNITIATTVSHNEFNRAVMDSMGNLKKNLQSYINETQALDDKSLAKIEALLNAAMTDQLEVVYKEKDATDAVPFQTLTILTTGAASGKPKIKTVDFFNESSTQISVKTFSEEYKHSIINLQKLMTQEIEREKGKEKKEGEVGGANRSSTSEGTGNNVLEGLKEERKEKSQERIREGVREDERKEHVREMETRKNEKVPEE